MCGCSEFYSLKANGQKMTMKDHNENRGGINPELIEPTPRMGPKLKAALLDAKRRILEMNAEVSHGDGSASPNHQPTKIC